MNLITNIIVKSGYKLESWDSYIQSQGVTPANKGMISYKMWTIVLLVFISHHSVTVDAIPLPQRMLEEGSYLIIPIGGGQTFYDNDVQDLAV